MDKVTLAARILFGLIFFVFGLNGFLQFLPMPPMPDAGGAFMGALAATGYFFPVLKATEVAVGVALLSNRFVPLALVIIAPIVVQIALFHTFLAPALALPIALIALNVYLAWAYRGSFRGVLDPKAQPSATPATAVATAD